MKHGAGDGTGLTSRRNLYFQYRYFSLNMFRAKQQCHLYQLLDFLSVILTYEYSIGSWQPCLYM